MVMRIGRLVRVMILVTMILFAHDWMVATIPLGPMLIVFILVHVCRPLCLRFPGGPNHVLVYLMLTRLNTTPLNMLAYPLGCLTYVRLNTLMPLTMVRILILLIPMCRCQLGARHGVRILALLIMCVKMPPIFIPPLRIQDIQTQEILLRGQVRDGLYHFSAESVALRPLAYNTAVQDCSTGDEVFTLWHKRLGHHSSIIKSQAVDYFLQFQKMILTQFGKSIKKFQSDWGGEFCAFASVLADNGIIHRLTCPHTSEQNGVAERKHRHIVETRFTLLAQADLPMAY
ncbi:hypothetical protein E1A91_A09G053300v1 [Gossypium mustelinum]|uniref:Integrase catalytic domain-containing protein n=1 Tax=Gossypium mustelinum TaxID=34275 RepID=A0A5D2XTZ9_GOSMU|nr:hypothetical protein E1A91_A09G053300v1 [Gossypium mustelinum]